VGEPVDVGEFQRQNLVPAQTCKGICVHNRVAEFAESCRGIDQLPYLID